MKLYSVFLCSFMLVGIAAFTSGDDNRCERCMHIVSVIGSITSHESRDRIYQTICESLQDADSDACKITFHQMSTEDMCQAIGECTLPLNDGVVFNTEIDVQEAGMVGTFCTLCKSFTQAAELFLSKPENQKYLLNILKGVCHIVPFLGNQCCALVDQYGPILIKVVSNLINPGLCKLFGFCSKDVEVLPAEKCELCELSMGIVYDTLRDPALDQRVEALTMALCMQSTGLDETCHSFGLEVSQYLVPALRDLREEEFLKTACQLSDMCQRD